ncbi:unnamed protein product [Parnassius mnemosyne]|uniref:Reverse transcriptase domain-containing protein n=1 Tax=Parnassius mnemosyne TaxID=213953 RepID=A0AAV1KPU7_9NEOP
MLSEFQQLQPNLTNLTAQRLSDQVRVILSRKILDDRLLEQLCSEYSTSSINSIPDSQRTLPGESDDLNVNNSNHNINITNLNNERVEQNCFDIDVSSQDSEYIRRTFECSLLEYKNTPIENRPKLRKLPNNKKTILTVASMNVLCKDYFEKSNSILETMSLLYCCAHAVCMIMKIPIISVQNFMKNNTEPKWKQRIQKRIDNTRKIIGKLLSYQTGNRRKKIITLVNQISNENNISHLDPHFPDKITEYIDTQKQKLKAWANRIRRYSERSKRYFQNRTFESNQKWVYRSWENTTTNSCTHGSPSLIECLNFWKNMWSNEVSHNEGEWIRATERKFSNLANMGSISITAEDVYSITRRLHNWKSPGPDGIHNFWLKWITSSHVRLAAQIQEAIECCELPRLLTTGITHLLYKNGNTTEPKNYRPITCLSTVYKLITAILNNKIYKHLENNNILSTAQNGCRKGSRGCKELLLIDTAICRQVFRNRKNMSAAWVDYKKAYDSVPHSWLKRVLEIYKIDDKICKFLSKLMGQWNTILNLPGKWQSSSIDSINIKRGIFQGDSLSPTWFCLALNPLSTVIEESGLGFRFRKENSPISHLLYMDDLKLFTSKESDLLLLLKLTHNFNNDIRMEFGIDKCAVINVNRGKIKDCNNFAITDDLHFSSLSETETYKYLGMAEALGINDKNIKENSKVKFMSRLKKVIKSHLSGGNKIRAYNSWVIPSLLYTFGITRWSQTELDDLDRRVRTLMTTHRMHHPRSSVMRLYLPRKDGGRGLLNIKNLHNREVYNLRDYFIKKKDTSRIHSDVVINDKSLTPLNMSAKDWQRPHTMTIDERKKVMSRAQNGCRGGGRGTKKPLLIDAVIGKVVKRNRRNLSAAWIDYKKAFDSVPHTWLKRVLELYKVDCTVQDFLGQCMGQWSTILCHLGERMTAAEDHIRIRRGIFQGDCLSPIWFCLALNPLSTLLEGSGRGCLFSCIPLAYLGGLRPN